MRPSFRKVNGFQTKKPVEAVAPTRGPFHGILWPGGAVGGVPTLDVSKI